MFSRSLNLCRSLHKLQANKVNLTVARNASGWMYREGPRPAQKKVIFLAEFGSAFMWWWILWHLFTEPEHITGEFPYPDTSKWTDAELGIPDTVE